ncbi:MAG: penicillin-binding protein 2, partial [bacterium]
MNELLQRERVPIRLAIEGNTMLRKITKPPLKTRMFRRVWRLYLIMYLALILLGLFIYRLVDLQILRGETFRDVADDQHEIEVPLESRRGYIYDRNQQELALDLPNFYTLGIYPAQLDRKMLLCQELAAMTGKPVYHYLERLNTTSKFIYLEWRLQEPHAERIRQSNISGVKLQKTAGRFYPHHRATAQLLGYTNVDGQGIAGVESYYDKILQGRSGWELHQRDAHGSSFWNPLKGYKLPKNGGSVKLSIDVIAQEVLHQELDAALALSRAEWAGGILINPKTGEILAVSSVPDFDPLRPSLSESKDHKLKPFTEQIEPGSVLKIITATGALDQGVVRPQEQIYCEMGHYCIGSKILRDAHPYGWLSFEDVIVHSSNIGVAKVAQLLGAKELYRYAARFGFGMCLDVEFPGEASGCLRPFQEWREIDQANIAIGQGISATMLQVAMAYAAIANDGVIMEPRLVLETTDSAGKTRTFPPRVMRTVMKPETAWILQQILTQVVERGTGKNAAIENVQIA